MACLVKEVLKLIHWMGVEDIGGNFFQLNSNALC